MRLSEMIYTEEEMETFRKKYEKLITKQTEKIEFQTNRIDGLEEENRKLKEKYNGLWEIYTSEANELKEENKKLKEYNGELIENHNKDISILCEENKKLEEENELLKQFLDKLMFNADVVNVQIHGELGDFYVRSDKKLKLNVKD